MMIDDLLEMEDVLAKISDIIRKSVVSADSERVVVNLYKDDYLYLIDPMRSKNDR